MRFGGFGWKSGFGFGDAGGRGVRLYAPIPAYATAAFSGTSYVAGSDATAPSKRYANIVAAAIGATLTNKGLSGRVLQNSLFSGGLPRADNLRDTFVADLTGANLKACVFIDCGFNDARCTNAPTYFNVAQFIVDFREILNGLLTLGYARADIYLLTPAHITDTGLNTGSAGFTGQTRAGFEEFVAATIQIAAEYGVRYCDVYSATNNAAFDAEVDANDHIHPVDPGHATIASAAINRMVATPNSRAAPASVSGSVAGETIVATCDPVSGATSYEFVPILSFVNGATTTSASAGATIENIASGTYRVKARAVFADGTKSPWTFNGSDLVVTSTLLIYDTFTDTDGVLLSAHVPEVGGAWSAQSSVTGNASPVVNSNDLYSPGTAGIYQNAAEPSDGDYYAEADLKWYSSVGSAGVAVRMQAGAHTLYFADYNGTGWRIFRTSAGTSTQLGATSNDTFTSGVKRLRLEITGATDPTLVLKVDGVTKITQQDTSGSQITTAGKAGVRISGAQTTTTRYHLDNFKAGEL